MALALPQVSVWRIVAVQAVVGVVVAALAWLVTGRMAAGWSAGYGALSVVLPAALFARGVVRQRQGGAGAAMAGIFGWELVKLVLCIAMLAAAQTGTRPELAGVAGRRLL